MCLARKNKSVTIITGFEWKQTSGYFEHRWSILVSHGLQTAAWRTHQLSCHLPADHHSNPSDWLSPKEIPCWNAATSFIHIYLTMYDFYKLHLLREVYHSFLKSTLRIICCLKWLCNRHYGFFFSHFGILILITNAIAILGNQKSAMATIGCPIFLGFIDIEYHGNFQHILAVSSKM